MKKIYLLVTIAFSFFMISSTKIFAHSPYYHANTFDLSTQVVNFGDSDYYVLRSPYRDVVRDSYKVFILSGSNLRFYYESGFNYFTNALDNGQFTYSTILGRISSYLTDYIDDKMIFLGDLLSVSYRAPIEYTLDIDYTSPIPFNFILSYSGTNHNNGWNSPINDKVHGLKLQFYGQVDDHDNMFTYVSIYSFDVNGNQVSALTFPYYSDNVFNLGIAILPDTTVSDNARTESYNSGYYNGRLSGITDGNENGYNQGKKDYGYNDNGTVISGDSAYNKGYEKGASDNMPNFFVLITDSVFTAVTRVGNVEILPNLKISYIAGIVLALGLVKFITGRKGDE